MLMDMIPGNKASDDLFVLFLSCYSCKYINAHPGNCFQLEQTATCAIFITSEHHVSETFYILSHHTKCRGFHVSSIELIKVYV